MKTPLLAVASALFASPAVADIYTIDFFPKLPQINAIQQLVFIGPAEGQITGTRLVIEFITLDGFNAADLTILLVANVDPVNPDGGFWYLTGTDLGWSGQGTFIADLTTDDLNGTIVPGVWQFDLGSIHKPPAYSGQFSLDTRFEVTVEGGVCYPDCNGDDALTVADYGCFQTAFVLGEMYADCNQDGILTVADFGCFQTQFALGCL